MESDQLTRALLREMLVCLQLLTEKVIGIEALLRLNANKKAVKSEVVVGHFAKDDGTFVPFQEVPLNDRLSALRQEATMRFGPLAADDNDEREE